MSRVLTLKVDPSLLSRLEKRCAKEGRSKGSVVREAIEKMLETPSKKSESASPSVEEITKALMKGKRLKVKVDWDEIYRQARIPMDISPEEEVRRGRMRGMIFE